MHRRDAESEEKTGGWAMGRRSIAEVISSKVICKQPGRYIGWPCVTKTPAGELLVVFSGDREAHTCPYGKTQIVRSADGGQTWSPPETINDTPLDDRDAGIIALSSGKLLVRWFTVYSPPGHPRLAHQSWQEFSSGIGEEDAARWTGPTLYDEEGSLRGHWLRASTDNGKTWEDPIHVAGTSPKPPIELDDGRLLMIGNNGYERQERTSAIVVEESHDQGQNWQVIASLSMFPDEEGGYVGEPHIVEAEPGNIVAMARHERRPYREEVRYLYQADSKDGGRTWSDWHQTPISGKPPHLIRLSDGRLLVTYGRRVPPFGQRACLSADHGRTWGTEHEIILRDDAPSDDLGYPASVELDDGTILAVYYQQEQADEKPCLMATHWRISEKEIPTR